MRTKSNEGEGNIPIILKMLPTNETYFLKHVERDEGEKKEDEDEDRMGRRNGVALYIGPRSRHLLKAIQI